MKLHVSVAARNRAFSKAIRRVRPIIEAVSIRFAEVELDNPIHSSILIGFSDEKPDDYFEEVYNDDGIFQVESGFSYPKSDSELRSDVFSKICKAVDLCPFSDSDRQKFISMLNDMKILLIT